MTHLQNTGNNILCPQQCGFRHGWSCETQLIETIDDLTRSLNDSGQTDAIALDFSKAFGKVPHQQLIYKLHHYGICDHLLTWIKQFLSNGIQV